jgi:hypothetical protein
VGEVCQNEHWECDGQLFGEVSPVLAVQVERGGFRVKLECGDRYEGPRDREGGRVRDGSCRGLSLARHVDHIVYTSHETLVVFARVSGP